MSNLQPPTVLRLIERADALAPVQLARLRKHLVRRARRVVRDIDLAEDLVQDTLIAVVEQFTRHRGDASFETWATAILKHKVADWYRSPARRRFVRADAEEGSLDLAVDGRPIGDEAAAVWAGPELGPETTTEQRETMHALDACVAAMSKNSGLALLMHDFQGYETPEVSARLGVSRDNVRTLLHRARKTVRDCIQHDWADCKGRDALRNELAAEREARHATLAEA